jgi:plastocyanin
MLRIRVSWVLACLGVSLLGGAIHPATRTVVVGDNFFSPPELIIEVGDTVRWTNGAGNHNVYSCTATQIGCDVVANESFTNGEPRTGPWFYSYTFSTAGDNPYVCQSHASFMHGRVTVRAPAEPPAVPDGASGDPVTVDKSGPSRGALSIVWDDGSCPAPNFNLLHGSGDSLPDTLAGPYGVEGQLCAVVSPLVWDDSPTLELPGDWIWWLVVATDGGPTEGPWGANTAGERLGPLPTGASGACGVTAKNAMGNCLP